MDREDEPHNNAIVLSPKEAEKLSLGLSDLICWIEGFNAARAGTDHANSGPMGVEAVRALNLKLKRLY